MRWTDKSIIPEDLNDRIARAKVAPDKLAIAYARVSTSHDEQIGSKENQTDECREYADKNGLHVIHTFECTESAKAQGRKVFNAMIETALQHGVKHLIMKDTSRLTRNLGDKDRINQLVKDAKIEVHFYLTGDTLNTESRFLISNIMSIIDADFSELLSKKMKHAAGKRIEKGLAVQVPAGYKFAEVQGTDGKTRVDTSIIEIDPKFKPIINEMFSLYLKKGYTFEKIADYFNSMKYKTRQKRPFYASTVNRMILNKFYTGKWFWVGKEKRWAKLGVPCPAYITEEQYTEIIKTVKLNSRGTKQRRKTQYLLTGLVLCSKCDCIASGNRWNNKRYYSHKCKADPKHGKPYWPEDLLVEKIDEEVEKYIYDEAHTDMLKARLKKLIKSKSSSTATIKGAIHKAQEELQNKKDALLENLLDKTITKQAYTRRNEKLEADKQALDDRLKTLADDLSEFHHDAVKVIDAVRDFTRLYARAKDSEKVRLLREMVNWVRFDGEVLKIAWKKPFDILLSEDAKLMITPSAIKTKGVILALGVADGA